MVVPHTHIYTDTSICAGDSILLKGIGGGTYTWNVLSGTVGSLSCPTCSNTWAKPAATTQYTLNTTGNASCSYVNDTVTVNVIPKVNPVVTITASPDTNFQKGTAVNFTANTTGGATMLSYTWMKNSSKVLGITSGTYNNANAKDNDSVYCELHVFDQCAFPADTFSNTLVLHEFDTTNGIEPVNCADRNFKLYPNPARSSVVLSTSGLNSQDAIVVIVNASGQTLYSDKWRKEEGKKEVSVSSLADGNYLILINIGGKINSIPFSIKH